MPTPFQYLAKKPWLYLKDFEYLKDATSWQDAFERSDNMHGFVVLNDVVGALSEYDCTLIIGDIILSTIKEYNLSKEELTRLGLLRFIPLLEILQKGRANLRANVIHVQAIWEEASQRMDPQCDHQIRMLVHALYQHEPPSVYSSETSHGHALRIVSWEMAWIVAHLRPQDGKSKKEVQVNELERQYARYKDLCIQKAATEAESIAPTVPYEKQLSQWIRASEERFISYKKLLEAAHRDKGSFPPDDPWVIEYKENLRWSKNMEESRLTALREEKTYYPGMTPSQFNDAVKRIKHNSEIRQAISTLETLVTTHTKPEHKPMIDKLIEHLASQQ